MTARVALAVAFTVLLSGCLSIGPPGSPQDGAIGAGRAIDDVVVVAVVDSGFNPYHWDFVSAFMPQHLDDDAANDLPLDADPATWLPGHPGAAAFASHEALPITLDLEDPEARVVGAPAGCTAPGPVCPPGLEVAAVEGLADNDADAWANVKRSTPEEVHMRWLPGTKVVGFVEFGNGNGLASSSHGVGTTSVAVGNIHGACPECVLVFVDGTGEAANEWVAQQDWIDLQTNSWGLSLTVRDRMYARSDTELQREAIDRGQSIFFSAGNGQANTFTVPNPTLWSSQEGPDWITTVGAIAPEDGSSYTGHGRPSDIAHIGSGYPAAGGTTVNGTQMFGGTSNATPVTAGTYARALYMLRREMADASRVQVGGTIAKGDAACGPANAQCALADGELSVNELREALFRSAQYTPTSMKVGASDTYVPAGTAETEFIAEGHGSFWGRLRPDGDWYADSDRIAAFARGDWYEPQDPDQVAWMIADSYCRQSLWGPWANGYWHEGVDLPPSDRTDWPLRTWLIEDCPVQGKAVLDAVRLVNGPDSPRAPVQ